MTAHPDYFLQDAVDQINDTIHRAGAKTASPRTLWSFGDCSPSISAFIIGAVKSTTSRSRWRSTPRQAVPSLRQPTGRA